jgi:hypothetical protein
MSPQERQDKMMQGVVPCMSFQHFGSKPSRSVVDKLRIILDAGDISQKQIAFENLLSGTKLSQYMNDCSRAKGWSDADILLSNWADNYNREHDPLLDPKTITTATGEESSPFNFTPNDTYDDNNMKVVETYESYHSNANNTDWNNFDISRYFD